MKPGTSILFLLFCYKNKILKVTFFSTLTLLKMFNCGRTRDDTHMTSMKIVQFSRSFTTLVHLCPKFVHPLELGHPISNDPNSISDESLAICFVVALYSCVCSCPKISWNIFFIDNYSHFTTHFAITLFYLHNLKT